MNQQDVIDVYIRLSQLGLAPSRRSFAREWCGRGPTLLADYRRRPGARVKSQTVEHLMMRLRMAVEVLPAATAAQVREIEADCARAGCWASLLKHRAAMAGST